MEQFDNKSNNQILQAKDDFNHFFKDDLYGKYRNLNNIILSRGGWNDSFIAFPKIFSFCLKYTLKKHWTGYSHSLGHKNVINALLGLINVEMAKNPYSQNNIALTIGNSFTLGIIFKQLSTLFPNAGIVTLNPFYPPIIKSISAYFKEITFVSSLQTEDKLLKEIESVIALNDIKILFLNNFIGVEGRIYSKKFWMTIMELVEKLNLFLIIDEGLSFDKLQYPESINNEKTIRVVSLSKKYGIPGMKIGFMVGGRKFMDEFYDYASTNYGGPLSVFFLLSEFLYIFEHAYITDGKKSTILKELGTRYNISNSLLTDLYTDFSETLKKNKENFNCNLYIFKDWIENNMQHFDAVYLFGGINTFIRLKPKFGTANSFFHHSISKFGVSVLPGKCLGEASDRLIRITLLEPKSVFKKGLKQLAKSLNDVVWFSTNIPKAVFLDFDGTLTKDTDNSITNDPGLLLSQLKSKGIFTALATGKGLYFVEDLLRNHNDLLNNYYVLYDGALVINPHTKKVLFSKPILQETVALLRDKILKITNNFYLNKIDGLYSKEINLSTDSSLYKFWKNGDDCSGVYQIYIRDLSPEQVLRLKRVLKHRDVSCYVFGGRRGLYGMMLHHSASNKGKAIKCVLKEMKIKEENSVIIGDGINDVPAFNLKKSYKVAMPNSVPEILKLANIVLEPEQKIGEFLSRHYGI